MELRKGFPTSVRLKEEVIIFVMDFEKVITMTTMLTIIRKIWTPWDVTIMDVNVHVLSRTENTNHCIRILGKLQTNFTKLQ